MQHWRPRDTRKTVRISVRVRTDDGWIDATVRNVSSRGMMLHSLQPLRRNQFVEIARGRHRVVGRIVWSDETVSGMQSRESVDLNGLLSQPNAAPATVRDDRRGNSRHIRPARVATFAERAEASRMMGRAIEHGFIVIAVACVAVVATISIGEAFQAPLEKVELAMAG